MRPQQDKSELVEGFFHVSADLPFLGHVPPGGQLPHGVVLLASGGNGMWVEYMTQPARFLTLSPKDLEPEGNQ